jgi:hypothetical protein
LSSGIRDKPGLYSETPSQKGRKEGGRERKKGRKEGRKKENKANKKG